MDKHISEIENILHKNSNFTIDDVSVFMRLKYGAKVFDSISDAYEFYHIDEGIREDITAASEFTISSSNYKCYAVTNDDYLACKSAYPEFIFVEYFDSKFIKEIAPNDNFIGIDVLQYFKRFHQEPYNSCHKEFFENVKKITGKTAIFSKDDIIKFFTSYYGAQYFDDPHQLKLSLQKYSQEIGVSNKKNNTTDTCYFLISGEQNLINPEDAYVIIETSYKNNQLITITCSHNRFKNSRFLYELINTNEAINALL